MKYRKLDDNGDIVFGQGNDDFFYDLYAVKQAIKTRLQLYFNTFWRDLSDGLPMFESILGSSGSQENIAAIDNIFSGRITGTQGVTSITFFDSEFDPDNRNYDYEARVQTIYSEEPIEIQDSIA